jgi:predicted nucleic acid-binding protein
MKMTSVYFDASVIVALFVVDDFNERADTLVRRLAPIPSVSDFAATEFASALSLRVRMSTLGTNEARAAFASFDEWKRGTEIVETRPSDLVAAEAWLRRLDLNLRTPDALNIALAHRIGALLATFDKRMAESAKRIGVEVVDLGETNADLSVDAPAPPGPNTNV